MNNYLRASSLERGAAVLYLIILLGAIALLSVALSGAFVSRENLQKRYPAQPPYTGNCDATKVDDPTNHSWLSIGEINCRPH